VSKPARFTLCEFAFLERFWDLPVKRLAKWTGRSKADIEEFVALHRLNKRAEKKAQKQDKKMGFQCPKESTK
jgi:hypothetical protein